MKLTSADKVLDLTMQQREAVARKVFAYEAVKEAITKAAGQGAGHVRIAQGLPVSLRSMKATKQLLAALKEAGYKAEWVDAVERERSNGKETGAFILYEELRISWAAVRIHSGPQSEAAE